MSEIMGPRNSVVGGNAESTENRWAAVHHFIFRSMKSRRIWYGNHTTHPVQILCDARIITYGRNICDACGVARRRCRTLSFLKMLLRRGSGVYISTSILFFISPREYQCAAIYKLYLSICLDQALLVEFKIFFCNCKNCILMLHNIHTRNVIIPLHKNNDAYKYPESNPIGPSLTILGHFLRFCSVFW